MKAALLLAGLFGLDACYDDPSGAMLEVSGDVTFDHVEVFFGIDAGTQTPLTPGRLLANRRFDERQLLLERVVAPDDLSTKTTTPEETRWSYLVPYNDVNKDLGRYALIVVSQGTTPVGAAELFDFEVPSDVLHRYFLPIEPLANEDFERWGADAECVRWTRPRVAEDPSQAFDTIAVVADAANADCDAFLDNDCDDLRHCDPTNTGAANGCFSADACLIPTAAGCAAGACINRVADEPKPSCEIATCIDARLCNACNSYDPAVIAECTANTSSGPGTHTDISIPFMGDTDRTLCTKPFYDVEIQFQFPCVDPRVEAVVVWYPTPGTTGPRFGIELLPGPTMQSCKLRVTEPFPGAVWMGTPHVVASVRSSSGGSYERVRFAFGVSDDARLQCMQATTVFDPDQLMGCGG